MIECVFLYKPGLSELGKSIVVLLLLSFNGYVEHVTMTENFFLRLCAITNDRIDAVF